MVMVMMGAAMGRFTETETVALNSADDIREFLRWGVIARVIGARQYSDEVCIWLEDGRKFRLNHTKECCEHVVVEEVILDGEPDDFIGALIVHADMVTSEDMGAEYEVPEWSPQESPFFTSESATWTFYRIMTTKGEIVLRWKGESNGYYSEAVDATGILCENTGG